MTYKNLKLGVWTKPGTDEVRVYVNTRFVERRNVISYADGCYLLANEDGSVGWRCGWRQGPDTMHRSEMAHLAMTDEEHGFLSRYLNAGDGLPTFAELLTRIADCATKDGNFSYTQYERRYTPKAA